MTGNRKRGPGLAGKLLMTSAALLVIPWLGYQALQATHEFLLLGQAQAQLLSASAVARLFHDRIDLLAAPPEASDKLVELPLYQLESHILLDGLDEDWDLLRGRRQQFNGNAISYQLLLGARENSLFGLLRVSDSTPVNRHPTHPMLDSSDHLRLYFIDADGRRRRMLVSFEGSGGTTTYETDKYWQSPSPPGPVRLLRGHVERDALGYVLEFSMPLDWLGEQRQIGIAVADKLAGDAAGLGELLTTFNADAGGDLNLLVERSAETDRVLQALAPRDSRIWILDSLGHVKASRGQLETQTRATSTPWRELADALQTALSEFLLGIPHGPTRDFDPGTTAVRQDPLVQQALAGTGGVQRRRAVGGTGEIIAAAQPIYDGTTVVGAVLVEKSTRQVLGLQRQTIERLAAFSALTVLVVAIALLGFAARLTYRIRRLDREADGAIDPHGRISEHRILHETNAADEIGELARSFNRMLDKLQGHQHFLAAIPRTLRHEINNPLNTISTSLEQLEVESTLQGKQQLDGAKRALRRIGLLVENLSEAASLEQALQAESTAPIDLASLLQNYCRNRQLRPPEPSLQVEVPQHPVVVRGSDIHLEQLLDKLLDNAIDFAEAETAIAIALRVANNRCMLSVENRGPTIDADQLTGIFQLMHSSREDRSGQGHFGLGLYVAKLISEYHGGTISAHNLPDGSGVAFRVSLPLEPAARGSAETTSS